MKVERSRRNEPARSDRTLCSRNRKRKNCPEGLLAFHLQQHEERIAYDESHGEASPIQTERPRNTEPSTIAAAAPIEGLPVVHECNMNSAAARPALRNSLDAVSWTISKVTRGKLFIESSWSRIRSPPVASEIRRRFHVSRIWIHFECLAFAAFI